MIELVVAAEAMTVTMNKPTSSFFTGLMPFLSPNRQCQSTERKICHSDVIYKNMQGISKFPYESLLAAERIVPR